MMPAAIGGSLIEGSERASIIVADQAVTAGSPQSDRAGRRSAVPVDREDEQATGSYRPAAHRWRRRMRGRVRCPPLPGVNPRRGNASTRRRRVTRLRRSTHGRTGPISWSSLLPVRASCGSPRSLNRRERADDQGGSPGRITSRCEQCRLLGLGSVSDPRSCQTTR